MALTRPRAYQIYDIDYKQAVRVVTTTNITLAGGAPSSVDGVSLSLNDRILVTGQSTGSQNGVYYITTLGSGSNGTWARSTDTNTTGELLSGTIVMVTEGVVYKDTQWKLITDDPITIGSTTLTFVQNYSANSISSGTSNVSVQANSDVSIAVAGSNVAVFSLGVQNITGNIIPTANVTYDLGNATNRFNDLYLANNSIFLGNVTLAASSTELTVNGATVVTASGSSTLSLSGNITGGNLISNAEIISVGNITSSANISGNYILGNGSQLTGLPATYGNSDVSEYLASGTNSNNIITIGNISGAYILGNGSALSSITGANVTGIVANATYAISSESSTTAGTVTTASQPNITSLGTLSSLDVTGNITSGNISGTNITGTLTTASQPNITSVGTLSSLDVTGNISGGNISTVGSITSGPVTITGHTTVTGNINAVGGDFTGNVAIGNVFVGGYYWANGVVFASGGGGGTPGGANTQIQFNDNGTFGGSSGLTFNKTTNAVATTGTFTATGNISGDNLIQGGTRVIKWTTVANTAPTNAVAGDFWYNSYTGIKYQYTNDGVGSTWVDQSPPTTFSTITVGSIVNSNANGVGNIGASGGSFNTVFAKATSAQYADLAEIYESDDNYAPGTVVVFGGEKEITISTHSHDTRVAGVISTNPAYIMNSMAEGLPVAFTGRVPCRVQGPVKKGDVIVTSTLPGTAQKIGFNYQPGCIIGKSLEAIEDSSVKIIEVVVGRF